MTNRASGRKIPLARTMRGVLSDRALAALEALDLQRDRTKTTSADDLRRIFAERSWSVSDKAIELERLAGGLEVHPGVYFGLYARTLPRRSMWSGSDVGWFAEGPSMYRSLYYGAAARARQEHAGAAYTQELERARNERKWLVLGGLGHDVYLSAHGGIGLSNVLDMDDDHYPEEIWASAAQYFEVAALVRDAMLFWFDGTDPLGWHRVWLDRPIGNDIAADLSAEPFAPATGLKCFAWVRDTLHIVERRSVHYYHDTTIGIPEAPEAIEVVQSALKRSRDLIWIAPAGTVTGAMLGRLPRCTRGGGAGLDVFRWGQPQGYFPRSYHPDIRWPT